MSGGKYFVKKEKVREIDLMYKERGLLSVYKQGLKDGHVSELEKENDFLINKNLELSELHENLCKKFDEVDIERLDLEKRLSEAVELAEEIKQWSEAYPKEVFYEPTPEQIADICDVSGTTLDSVSAMVLRNFTKQWGDRAKTFLSKHKETK
jgi:hypothetical protein